MGTPDFAVPSLKKIFEAGFEVVAVITAPDKPKGRGRKLTYSPVKETAAEFGIPVLQPTNLKAPEFIEELKSYQANLQVVVAFRMLPEVVWKMPEYGTFNLHASLLPQYRGAAPINWAIINGEIVTGVSTFFLKHEIDTGSIIFREEEPINFNDTAGSLYERLMIKGGDLVLKTVESIADKDYHLEEQKEAGELKTAPKICKEDCEINCNKPVEDVYNFIRGLSPFPGAYTHLNGKYFKIYFGEISYDNNGSLPGSVITDNKSYVHIKAKDGYFKVTDFQPEGKKRMNPKEYLIGNEL